MPRVEWHRTLWRSSTEGNISSSRLKLKLSNPPHSRHKHLLPRWAAILDNELHSMASLHLVLLLLLLLHMPATEQHTDNLRDRQQLLLLLWVRQQSQAIDQRRASGSNNNLLLSRLMLFNRNPRLHRLITKPPSLHTINTLLLLNNSLRHTNSKTRRLNRTTLSALLLYTDKVMPMADATHLLSLSNPLCNHLSNHISMAVQ